ncbi:hypothetical protein [Actibacterium lipolyticum]|uniref:Uncharacterized protein n=1 Tax=Actibacterium lipolyticum TaxID=1524263 RepID=A0A238JM85_9RHOB|nr:hypothetical protein [Actibacterium lipolyticum]SMX30886.1 hypothetical protein COL8621_00168 [Actibacterium lipolyticum]
MFSSVPRSYSVFDKSPWRLLLPRALADANHVPTMLREEEQQLYFWLTSLWAEGSGAIVDLGCFVGGSTARLAAGHAAAGLASKIHAFDRFTSDEQTKKKLLYPAGIEVFKGHDTLPLATALLGRWADRITLHPGEIEHAVWNEPIELLVMDASKTASSADNMAEIFFPHLIAGQSLLVQQDLMHWSQPWIAAQMELLSEYFTPLAFCRDSTIVYGCTKVPTLKALKGAQVGGLSDDALISLLEKAKHTLSAFVEAQQFDEMIKAIRANPKERTAWRFQRP